MSTKNQETRDRLLVTAIEAFEKAIHKLDGVNYEKLIEANSKRASIKLTLTVR